MPWGSMDTKMNMNEQHVPVAKKVNGVPGYIRRKVASRSKKMVFYFFSSALLRPQLEYYVEFWAHQYQKDLDILKRVQQRAPKVMKGLL